MGSSSYVLAEAQHAMSTNGEPQRQAAALNPQALHLADMARILSASGPKPVTVEMLEADIDDGAPTNRDRTMNLVEYARWLIRETLHGGD
jgi:hypothetical protein